MYAALSSDLEKCARQVLDENLTDEEEQFWGRIIARATFSYIEGVVFCMKQQAYKYYQAFGKDGVRPVNLTEAELSFMLEEDYELNDKAEVITQRAKVPLVKSIRLAFRVLARVCFVNYELNVSDHRWNSFKSAIKIRDRLMHPKSLADLTITGEEGELIIDTITWFRENISNLFVMANRGLVENKRFLEAQNMKLTEELDASRKQLEMVQNVFKPNDISKAAPKKSFDPTA
jgi:hypothetical protein